MSGSSSASARRFRITRRCTPTWAFPLTIGPDCVIGHNVILHGCTIGAHALIGMGAIVLNGARIGAGSLVGAGALITEGKSFPEKSLIVGAPARAIRTLDDCGGVRRSPPAPIFTSATSSDLRRAEAGRMTPIRPLT